MKKWMIKLIIAAVILIVIAVGIRLVVRKVLTGEGISKITEKVTEGVAKKATEVAEKIQDEEAEVATEAEVPAKKVSSGKMNDEKWVEIFAYSQYKLAKYSEESEKIKTTDGITRAAEKYTKDIENMYKKFGVTEEEFSTYSEKLSEENIEHYVKLIERASERVEELKKAGK
ncbi:MAG: hypothetical protein KAT41_01030 [Candidatus Marinimicrobia bacterium]|nr:hypothetical protein [Candidatus Neomarinimicrobiota bacterium]